LSERDEIRMVLGVSPRAQRWDSRYNAPLGMHTRPSDQCQPTTGRFVRRGLSNLDLLTTEQSLLALDATVAAADSAIVLDQIAVFRALGGGWEKSSAE
jgi:hypothetical protein